MRRGYVGQLIAVVLAASVVTDSWAAGFSITPATTANGTLSPAAPFSVATGQTAQLTADADAGFVAAVGGSCGGSLSGSTYTTQPITANCSVVAAFFDDIFVDEFQGPEQPTAIVIVPTAHSFAGQSFSINATVVSKSGVPNGSFSVIDNAHPANVCGPATLTSGNGSCDIAWSKPGVFMISAVFSPVAGFLASASAPVTHVVDSAPSTTTVNVSQVGFPGAPVQATATVTGNAGAGSPTGNVAFSTTGSPAFLGSCVLVATTSSQSSCAGSNMESAGSQTFTALYGGDSTYSSSSGSAVLNVE